MCLWALLLASLAGCLRSNPPANDPLGGHDPDAIEWEVAADVATVIRVSWSTEKATTGHVEFGPSEAHGLLWRIGMDGSSTAIIEGIDTLSHDWVQHPDGT